MAINTHKSVIWFDCVVLPSVELRENLLRQCAAATAAGVPAAGRGVPEVGPSASIAPPRGPSAGSNRPSYVSSAAA